MRSISETDIVTLCSEDIRPAPLEILALNTRFLCQPLENDAMQIKTALLVLAWQNGSRPCLLIVANPSSTEDGLEVSVGGVIREERVEKEVSEILSESDVLVNFPRNLVNKRRMRMRN
jgi:hypothetical protein